ncbi:uncharacterized protein B0T15DRAFT_12750 [Chaetomium strumarium]|uniref:Uncharacterized protein n=1 Tax=Chaetomium strumarium TaxID=1170767 RepID=A0AAJ0M5D0_9PEZI|nr:hypothetical protein B0T15DRAFT_12750 [Chaetomium strumarium]
MAVVYASMPSQEELVALFSRNLTLDPMYQAAPAPEPAPVPAQESNEERKIVYISQHYTHSAHIARQETQPTRPASEPPRGEHAAVERVLREHSVDPSGLSSAQLELFKTVDAPQQLRLIELWRVCPPTSSVNNPTLAWSTTTVDQEEALARLRFEQQQQQLVDQQLQQELEMDLQPETEAETETVMSLDGTPLTPIQAGDGRWIGGPTLATSAYDYMEPYMMSGYEEMARREYEESARRAYAESCAPPVKENNSMSAPAALVAGGGGGMTFNPAHADPVYKTTLAAGVDWRTEAAMADRYGQIMAMREDEEML